MVQDLQARSKILDSKIMEILVKVRAGQFIRVPGLMQAMASPDPH